ncbi:Amino acid transporter, transmembrane [Corchorus olitorius]|uniref:Amino acid transporter, transmembrane n=1 Tax=Corchorus olitorius TaxID=93759 RepID=A0A1R3KIU4_9ROSI|nr:Amino acid transporter, transmembrane [Corchorus olitorius]
MGEGDVYDFNYEETPLLEKQQTESNLINRTGNIWTAVAHIITGVIGAGVLSLAWSMAQLGWIAGPLAMLLFASVTLISTFLLSNCYTTPHPELGLIRNRSYTDAVNITLGSTNAWVCSLFVQVGLYGMGIAYTITSGISMRAIQKSNCYHQQGHDAPCHYQDIYYMLAFGAVQLLLSQIPDFHNIHWLSVLAAIMSFAYSFIGFALGIAKVIGNGYVKGSIRGISTYSSAEKVWLVSQALGDIAFAYPYSLILIEIQDTLNSPPPGTKTMKKASIIAISATTFFYLCCGGLGYAAFGDETPGNLLTGFGFYEPYWLIDVANACIVIHLIGGYQVYCQPLFANVEKWISYKFPDSALISKDFNLKLPLIPAFQLNLLKLCFRSVFVASTTTIGMLFPYFNQVLGVLGGFYFWPLSIYFPVQMYIKQRHIEAWSRNWVALQSFSMFCLPVTLFALVGSIQGLISAKLS